YLPLSAVLTRAEVYDAFYDDYENLTAFLHSHSYTGNALACRAALATLDIFASEDVLGRNRELATRMRRSVASLEDHPHVGEIRQTGMILAIELVKDKATRTGYDWRERRGLSVYRHGLEQGVLLRPLGNVVYFMPPYAITPEQIERMAGVAIEGIEHAVRD
ncbi:MAG TPA: aminotransferase class III-fold pyridoxal phosphate-dependent enzyme, partial [Gammaproteobacteria bacterium]|nr:aminotransferase class III-fold pyridoxal phosphate-dependent enzyme [Gammaproteobacteria bacterium]